MLANGRWDLIRRLKGCMKNQQIHQLFIQFINYVWQLLHVSALHCHPQGAFLVPSERCSVEEQSLECCGWACFFFVTSLDAKRPSTIFYRCSSIEHLSEGTRNAP